jgi:endonuclease/exonuclease/phosphatase family metal-dependent hydrolase
MVRVVLTGRTLVVALLLTGCAYTINLLNPASPRFAGEYAMRAEDAGVSAPIRIVTFNVKLARRIDRAVAVLQSDSLRGADIITLEEMDDRGVDDIARALHLNYVYYPGSIHPTEHKYFGPAVLSRWPITRSRKLLLPHESWTRHQRRTATVAEVVVHGVPMRVYGVHLETPGGAPDHRVREDQIRTVLADGAAFAGPVIIAGDFNSYSIGLFLERQGYCWLTRHIDPTISIFTWDHIFVRGLRPTCPRRPSAGVVRETRGASDHRPVWAVAVPHARVSHGMARVAGTS